jgi:hypothetical protein
MTAMPLYDKIEDLIQSVPMTQAAAERYLSGLSDREQQQIIAAIYIGRDHLNSHSLNPNDDISRRCVDHISKHDYAQIISEKGANIATYLKKIVTCANASGFDLNTL